MQEQNPGFNLDRFKDLKDIDGRRRFEDIHSSQQVNDVNKNNQKVKKKKFIKYENALEELNESTTSVYKHALRDKASEAVIKLAGFQTLMNRNNVCSPNAVVLDKVQSPLKEPEKVAGVDNSFDINISKMSLTKQMPSKIDENKKQFADLLKQTLAHKLEISLKRKKEKEQLASPENYALRRFNKENTELDDQPSIHLVSVDGPDPN